MVRRKISTYKILSINLEIFPLGERISLLKISSKDQEKDLNNFS